MKIPFTTSLKLALQGKWVTRIITIILSAFAFTLFAIGTMGFTYSYSDFLTRGYLNYKGDSSFVVIEAANREELTVKDAKAVEETTDFRFVYSTENIAWGYFIGDQIDMRGVELNEGFGAADLYHAWLESFSGTVSLAGSEDDYKSMRYSLLAGKFPTEENEIAISEAHYESFVKYNYCNVAKNFMQVQLSDGTWGCTFDETLPRGEIIPITSYEDMLGLTLGHGDPNRDAWAGEYKIVGIVQTNYDYQRSKEFDRGYYPAASIMRSAQWKSRNEHVKRIFTGEVHDYKTMKKCVDTVLTFKERAESEGIDYETTNYPMLRRMDALIPSNVLGGYQDTDIIAFFIGGAGIVLGIFATALNGYLVSESIRGKQKKIGIIRSMGGDRKTVKKIFILETLFTATVIFLSSLVLSLAGYYGFVRRLTTYQSFGVSFLVYNGWTVLILAAVCYVVPLLSTLLPLRRFFKQTIVDNLSGNYKKKKNCRL